jgi:hypothetical protein
MTNAYTDSALNGMKERLTNEFADRPRAGAAACFDYVTKDLLAEARILDFVPLLAYRRARGSVARLRQRSRRPHKAPDDRRSR